MEIPQVKFPPLIKVEKIPEEVISEKEGFEKLKIENFEDLALQEDLRLAIIDVMNGLKIEINVRKD